MKWAKSLAGTAILIALLSVGGCAASEALVARDDAALPGGVAVSVLQTRSDVVARKLVVRVDNESPSELTVSGVELRSSQFAVPAVWESDSTAIEAGRTVDLRLALPEPACGDTRSDAIVQLDFAIGDSSGTVEVRPTDDAGRLLELRTTECFEASITAISSITAATLPREVLREGLVLAELDITAVGSGSAGGVTIVSASGTTLFALSDPVSGAAVPSIPLALPLSGRGDSVVTLLLQPNRCDPHALAEDKRGTIFPLRIMSAEGIEGIRYVVASDDVRAGLYSFFARACGLP